jgi:hypothetical protein
MKGSKSRLFIHATVRGQPFELSQVGSESAVAGHGAELKGGPGIEFDVGVAKTVLKDSQEVR